MMKISAETARHAVVLAAGQGTRLLPLTSNRPKCLVPVNGKGMLQNALHLLADRGVEHARIVVGHMSEIVIATIPSRVGDMRVEFVQNPEYASTNSMYSLALGLSGLEERTWVLEGDVFFDASLLEITCSADITWLVDAHRTDLGGAYVCFDERGRAVRLEIVRNGANPPRDSGKSVGILQLSAAAVAACHRWLEQGIAEGKKNLYYDLILAEHFDSAKVEARDVGAARWFEIDTPDELARAEEMFR